MNSAITGQPITHYRILKKLGGGIGMVYEAEEINLGRRAAPLLPAYVRPYKTPMRCDRDP